MEAPLDKPPSPKGYGAGTLAYELALGLGLVDLETARRTRLTLWHP